MPALYIGLMSGTSMDGVDAALVRFDGRKPRLVEALTVPYSDSLAATLRGINSSTPLGDVLMADARVAIHFVDAVYELLAAAGTRSDEITAIGSHGQTVWHAPAADPPVTFQIGDPNRISQRTGITVVADFRRRDIAAGGEGAPLAPIFHASLLRGDADRAIVNVGGIANLSVVPADASAPIRGFDCGPGNVLLDDWIRRTRGLAFDRDGAWARGGAVQRQLLERLKADAFFHKTPPRSTGPEHFNGDWLCRQLPQAVADDDVQATLVELTATTVADAVREHAPTAKEVLLCGGGAHNTFLRERIAALLNGLNVATTDEAGVDPDYVEAIGFAWLARQTLAGQPGNVPEVTGAPHRVILGGIYQGTSDT